VPDQWLPIEDLAGVYGRFASGMRDANLNLLRAGVACSRRPARAAASMDLVPRGDIQTHVYVLTEQQKVLFLFFKGPATTDLLLDLTIQFQLAAGIPPVHPDLFYWQTCPRLVLPPFLAADPTQAERRLLARALDDNHPEKLQCLQLGHDLLAVKDADDPVLARVARLEPGAAQARLVYQPVLDLSGHRAIRYEPATFLELLGQIEDWARSGFQSGISRDLRLPVPAATRPAPRIVIAVIQAWLAARRGAVPPELHPLLQSFSPTFAVNRFESAIVLRLRPDGSLAERQSEDAFRLRMRIQPREENGSPQVSVSLGPPDFLVDGKLHDALLDAMLGDLPIGRLFRDSQLPKSQRARFVSWLKSGAANAVVFRAARDGDRDTDLFVFRADWDGERRVAIAAAIVEVDTADYSVRIRDEPGSMVLLYTDLPGNGLQLSEVPALPRYLMSLVFMLNCWIGSLQGEAA
jgi:hypothetical protein